MSTENPSMDRPEFDALARDLRARAAEQQRAAAQSTGERVMAKAAQLLVEGRLSALDLAALHALRLRLEAGQ